MEEKIEETKLDEQNAKQQKAVVIPDGYYMGANGALYPNGTPQFGIATNIAPNATTNGKSAHSKQNTKKTGYFVAGLIMTLLAIGFLVLTVFSILDTMDKINAGDATGILTFLLFLIGPGWVTFLPATIFFGLGLFFGIAGLKSSSKVLKAFNIFFIIICSLVGLALLLLVSLVTLGIMA